MIGVIVLPGPSSTMHGLDTQRSLSLLSLGDRPILQHIVESLVVQGVTSIELIVGHAPERVEAMLGNGDRWGCSFRYHLATQPERPYRSLKIIDRTKSESWVLIHAERFPCLNISTLPVTKTVLYYGRPQGDLNERPDPSVVEGSESESWWGTAVFPAGDMSERLANKTPNELHEYLQQMVISAEATVIAVTEWINASTPAALLETQSRLLSRQLNGLMISGIERQPGIWVSRNVVIHPSVELIAPLYIGPNCRLNSGVKLGPDVVISGDCIVDTNTSIEQSLVMPGSYIGEGLELNKTVVDRNLLINVRLGTSVDIIESFLLGGLEQTTRQSWLGRAIQSILALSLIVFLLPISLLSLIYFVVVRRVSYTSVEVIQLPAGKNTFSTRSYALPCLGADAWKVHRPAGWDAFLRQFLPGLFAIVSGRISFVGLPPRSEEEIQQLPAEWRAIYQEGRAGLITEAGFAVPDAEDETQLYLADAYYTARQSWLYDIRLASKYFFCLIVPMREGSS